MSTPPDTPSVPPVRREPTGPAGHLGQFDSYRVVACGAVVLQHSLLWTVPGGVVTAWAFVMLLHFSRTAFFFLTAFLLSYVETVRPRSVLKFWSRRFVRLGVPYLFWTALYWVFTLVDQPGTWSHAGSLLWRDVVFGYYQLYFAVVLFQLYVVFPLLYRTLRSCRHQARIMLASGSFALLLAADLHWPGCFGPLGAATRWIEQYWPWSRDPLTYQEQFVAGVLVGLHVDQIRPFVQRWWRAVMAGAAVIGTGATLWYLTAVWTGSSTGRASDLYQPVAFLWFTAAVAALECGTWWWYQRTTHGHPPRHRFLSASYLGRLTVGVFFSHILFINLVRSALEALGVTTHVGWAGEVLLLYGLTLAVSALFTAAVLRTPLRWIFGSTAPPPPFEPRPAPAIEPWVAMEMDPAS